MTATATARQTLPRASDTFSRATIALHWLMAAMILGAIAFIELRELFPKGSEARDAMKAIHFMLGLSVLALVIVRIAARFTSPTPAITPRPAAWQTALSHIMHLAFYGLMIALPILGWLTLSAAGKPVPFFGLTLPALVMENKDAAGWYKDVHHILGDVIFWFIALHAGAALVHHYAVKDNTLVRMLPSK